MKKLRFLIATVFLLTISAMSQSGAMEKSKGAADQAFEKQYRAYAEALMKGDMAALDKIWASDYVFINPRGEVVTKAQRVANLKSGATELKSVNPTRERLQIHGEVAIDIGHLRLEGSKYSSQESSGEYRYMNVWVKRQGQWQLQANQITPIKK
jgi:ketosteroid isomerase-like protein